LSVLNNDTAPRSSSVGITERRILEVPGSNLTWKPGVLAGFSCDISSSHGGEYEAQNLLGCIAVFLIECKRTLIVLMMEAARTSETSVDIQLRTRQYIPEDSERDFSCLFLNSS
jgi:hypothetical protein